MKKINGLYKHCTTWGTLINYKYRGLNIDKNSNGKRKTYWQYTACILSKNLFFGGDTLEEICKKIDKYYENIKPDIDIID